MCEFHPSNEFTEVCEEEARKREARARASMRCPIVKKILKSISESEEYKYCDREYALQRALRELDSPEEAGARSVLLKLLKLP